MCGRYEIRLDTAGENGGPDAKLAAIAASLERRFPGVCKTGEIAPGDTAPAVIAREEHIVAVPATFGLAGFDGKPLINARAETAAVKPTFRAEPGAAVMYLCGLYNVVEGTVRFVILTREANASVAPIHDRMPVIIGEGDVRAYLTDYDAAMQILGSSAPTLSSTAYTEGRGFS